MRSIIIIRRERWGKGYYPCRIFWGIRIFADLSMAAVSGGEQVIHAEELSARLTASSVQKITGEHREKGQGDIKALYTASHRQPY